MAFCLPGLDICENQESQGWQTFFSEARLVQSLEKKTTPGPGPALCMRISLMSDSRKQSFTASTRLSSNPAQDEVQWVWWRICDNDISTLSSLLTPHQDSARHCLYFNSRKLIVNCHCYTLVHLPSPTKYDYHTLSGENRIFIILFNNISN